MTKIACHRPLPVPRDSGGIGPLGAAVPLAASRGLRVFREIGPVEAARPLVLVGGGFGFLVTRHLGTPLGTSQPSARLAGGSRKMPGEVDPGIGNGAFPDEVSDCRSVPRSPEIPLHRPGSGEVDQVPLNSRGGNGTMLKSAAMVSGADKGPLFAKAPVRRPGFPNLPSAQGGRRIARRGAGNGRRGG